MKLHNFIIICACALVACACHQGKATDEAARQERDSLQRVIDGKDAELDDIMGTFNEIQEGIRRITEAEGRVTVADATRENASSREVIRENLSYIEQAMKQNRDMVAQLKEKLRHTHSSPTMASGMLMPWSAIQSISFCHRFQSQKAME